jgi:hypothetical protein
MLKPARADLRACIYSEAKKVTSRRCGKMRASRRSGRILGEDRGAMMMMMIMMMMMMQTLVRIIKLS